MVSNESSRCKESDKCIDFVFPTIWVPRHRPRPFLAYYAPLFSYQFTNNTHVVYQTRVFGEIQQDTRAGLPPEVLISFSLTINHFVPRHYTGCRELVLRAREYVSPAGAVPIRSLVTGRLASGGDRTTTPSRRDKSIK